VFLEYYSVMMKSDSARIDQTEGQPIRHVDVGPHIRHGLEENQQEFSFARDDGMIVALITNRVRAMVMVLRDVDDPGEHVAIPGAAGSSSGYRLVNGQVDQYADDDTVELHRAVACVEHLMQYGHWPEDVAVWCDR